MLNEEFFNFAKTTPWKIIICSEGDECWCRAISTEIPIYDENDRLHLVIDTGSVSKYVIEYLVELHNQKLKSC